MILIGEVSKNGMSFVLFELLNLILTFKTFQKFVRKVLKSMNIKLLNI